MRKELLEQLYNNRLLRTREEYNMFEDGLNILSQEIKENDIVEICRIFDDKTKDDEVMFGLIHLGEIFTSENAFCCGQAFLGSFLSLLNMRVF